MEVAAILSEISNKPTHFSVIAVLLAIIPILSVFFFRKTKGKLPPGPRPLPIIGNVHQFFKKPYIQFIEMANTYGPMFHVRMFSQDMIILSDPKLVKELFNHKQTTGRQLDNPVVYQMTQGPHGTANSIGRTWLEQRAFTLKALQEQGFNKSSMEDVVLEEVKATLAWLGRRERQSIPAVRIFNEPVVNALWNIVASQRYEWENGKSHVVTVCSNMIAAFLKVTSNGLAFAPFLRFIFPDSMGWNEYVKTTEAVQKMFREEVEERTREGKLTRFDYIDTHLAEIQRTTDPGSSFYKETGHRNLMVGLFDLFIGASESSSITLSWALLYLSLFPEEQAKMHLEMDRVLGTSDVIPQLAYRPQMPFLEAVILETMRKSAIVALGVPHVVMEDMKFKGYSFKKGTTLICNIFGIQNNPSVWGDPENFRPSRFLSEDGTQVISNENFIPFLEGKRRCIGEKMAREQLFLFMAGIFHKYRVRLAEPPTKSKKEMMVPRDGDFLLIPKDFNVVLVPRH